MDVLDRLRRSRRRWRIATVATLVLWLGTVAVALYALIDQGVTLAYHDDSWMHLQRAESLLERVVLRISPSTTKAELVAVLRELGAESFESDGATYADGLGFYFGRDGRLACVTADYPPEAGRCAPFAAPAQ